MAEERNLATARAPEMAGGESEPTKEDLQRRMEEARESISQTVNDIKDTVTTQYENVRETISQSLDWREQYRRRPVAFSVGALGVGLVLGYSVGGAFGGDEDDLAGRYYDAEGVADDGGVLRSYAGQAITGGAYGASAYASAQPTSQGAPRQSSGNDYAEASSVGVSASRPSYSTGYESSTAGEGDDKPSLISRFRETQAYEKLQHEVGNLGNRFVEELSKTAQTVVLPAILGKLKDFIGVDLSTQREVAQRSRLEQQATVARAEADKSDQSAGVSAPASGTGGYGKSL